MRHLARSTWLRALLSIVILAWLARRVDMTEAARALWRVSPLHVLVVLALVLLDRAVMIWRWVLLLRVSGSPIRLKSAAWIFLVSSFVGSFLPAGIGGDAARAWALKERTSRGSEAVASVAMDRVLGVVALALLAAVGASLWTTRLEGPFRRWTLAIAVLTIAGVVAVLQADRVARWVLPGAWHGRAGARHMIKLSDAMAGYRSRPALLGGVLGLSLLVQWLRVVQAWLLGLGLGITIPFSYYLVFMPIGLFILLLPLSISGFGLPQGVIVWLLRPVGVPDELSFALSTLIVLTGLAGNLPGAWLYLRPRRQ